MGLDNIPRNYPCKTKGTAVMAPRLNRDGEQIVDPDTNEPMTVIDCQATAACGGCPWKNAHVRAGEPGGAVYGMLGTDCWYRGKYGNYLLEEIGVYDETEAITFYGDNIDATEKSVSACIRTADAISDALNDEPEIFADGENITEQLRYAEFWLRWVAEEADGSVCWY